MPIEVGGSPMMHDFALTENYVVVYDLPVVFDKAMATRGDAAGRAAPGPADDVRDHRPQPAARPGDRPDRPRRAPRATRRTLPYSWDPDYPARIGLLPREGGSADVRWFEIDPCFVFHTLNAYEDGDTVVVDVVRHDRMFATVLNGPDEGPATLARFTIDLAAGKVREDRFDEHAQEFPRIDERLTGRRHRFGYSVGFEDGVPGDAVLRHDLAAGSTAVRNLGAGREASEFCFVPGDGTDRGGRRSADGLRLRPGGRHQQPGDARRRDARGHGGSAPPRARARRVPRELGTDRRLTRESGRHPADPVCAWIGSGDAIDRGETLAPAVRVPCAGWAS